MGRRSAKRKGGHKLASPKPTEAFPASQQQQRTQSNGKRNASRFGQGALLAGAVVTFSVSTLLSRSLEAYLGPPSHRHECLTNWATSPAFDKYDAVPQITWDNTMDTKEQIAQIVQAKTAVIINGAPVATQWTALEKWRNSSYLTENVDMLHRVRYKQTSQFINEQRSMLVDTAMKADLVDGFTESSIDLPTSQFVEHDTSSKGNGLHYYYASTIENDFGPISNDIEPSSLFHIQNAQVKTTVPYVWMSHGNNSASMHYDTAFNFNVQIVGHKRFTLLPVSAWASIHLHPSYHLSQRQSQIDLLTKPDPERFTMFNSSLVPQQAILSPGQVLYVPPYLFHSVETCDFCVNVNFFSDFDAFLGASDVLKRPLFITEILKEKPETAPKVIASYVVDVAASLRAVVQIPELCKTDDVEVLEIAAAARGNPENVEGVANLLNTSLQSRWAPMFDRIKCADWEPSKCPRLFADNQDEASTIDARAETGRSEHINSLIKEAKVASCERNVDVDVLDMVLTDWLEAVVSRDLGVSTTCAFLRCMTHQLLED